MNNIKVQNDEGRWYILSDKRMQELPEDENQTSLRIIRRSTIKRYFSHGGSRIDIRYTNSTDVVGFDVFKLPSGTIEVGCCAFSPATVETIKKWALGPKTVRRKKRKAK